MECCAHCQAAGDLFGEAKARRDVRRYRKKGPDNTTRLILDAVRGNGLSDSSLLDVGAGVGAIHHELLGVEVTSATHVEASPAYLSEARGETARRGNDSRVEFVEGDFVDVATRVGDADVVTLDRVICCYPNCGTLLDAAAGKARRFIAFSHPRDNWAVRVVIRFINLLCRVRGPAFRVFVHPDEEVDATIRKVGFRLHSLRTTLVWQVRLYERRTGEHAA